LTRATYVESFLVLNAVGGDCLEDFDALREDGGLAEMLGHAVPSAEAARKFLYQFHEGEKIEQAQQALAAGRVSYIPEESSALQGLASGESRRSAGAGTTLRRAEDRHPGCGCHGHRELEARSQAHL